MNQPILRLHNSLRNEIIENWDDDDLVVGGDDFRLRSSSLTLSATTNTSQHRDSVSSRLSIRSEIESNHGDDERQVHVPGDDERSTIDAILTAKRAGIPLPTDVPASALLGGSIRRLGGKKLGKPIQDDWDDGDIEFPSHGELRIKNYDETSFPDALRQVSGPNSLQGSPIRQIQTAPRSCNSPPITLRSQKNSKTLLDRFKDEVEDENSHSEAIKVFKSRPAPNLSSHVTPPTPCCKQDVTEIEEFEQDFQLPLNDEPLQLSVRKDFPRTPSIIQDEFDEWGEGGSLGTRHGGKRDRGSIRSSSVTAPSPSVSSSLTIESEDEALDGLVLPSGPLRFDEILKKKHQDQTLDSNSEERLYFPEPNDDFLSGLEIGFGDPFDFKKLKVNRNVKIKTTYQTNPVRPKAAVSLTFTKKISNSSNSSRIPRPLSGYERLPSSLEPVSESGGPIVSRIHRSHSRIGCHSSHTSVNSLTTPITPTTISAPPSSPHQREHISNPPFAGLGKEHTATTSAQLLKLKRSMPIIRSSQSNTKAVFNPRLDRPGSYNDGSRPTPFFRPKSPIERGRGAESIHNHVKSHHMPFLPAGASNSQSHHVLAKTSRNFPRHDSQSSSNSVERHPSSRGVSRSTMRSPSPHRKGADALAREAATRRLLTKPVIRRHFGDGCELDAFDDLPISRDSEQRFIKEPLIRGPPKPCIYRKKPQQESRPALSIRSGDHLPRFARDTTASRIAREKTIAQRSQSNHRTPLSTLTNNWKAKLAASTGLNNKKSHPMKPKNGSNASPKPQLIKQIGKSNNPKSLKGMYYNPQTFRWEGNDVDLSSFDLPSSPSAGSGPSIAIKETNHIYHNKENLTPRPALIQHVKSTHNVQVIGNMVFDPQRMCWLKMPSKRGKHLSNIENTTHVLDSSNEEEENDEDVFRDVPDLEDSHPGDSFSGFLNGDGLREDFIVGEEFDVGPEFVRRQREEEERWKRKVEMWIQTDTGIDRGNIEWRWIIRDMVMNHEI